jgi:sugar O-acyltransferase (sialic acid O-acetyltransferase NeuD family)
MLEKVLIGAGGFAREVKAQMGQLDMKCFVDDEYYTPMHDHPQNIHPISKFNPKTQQALVVIGNPHDRAEMVKKMPEGTKYFSYIDPSAQILGNNVVIGDGCMICAGCIITTNVKIEDHAQLNLLTTIGHDCRIGSYFTTAPGVKISGNCTIGDRVYFGTSACIREKLTVVDDVTIGLNGGVVKNITEAGTYVGTPTKRIER